VQRSVAATPELCNLLDQLRDQTRWGYYFPGKSGGHAHPSMVWRHIRDVVGVNPHALRHRAGTVVYNRMGKDIRAAQVFLGHANSHTTEIYVHIERDDLLKASQAARLAA
jgi:integrase